MKKYVKLLCSVCARQKDHLIDSTHYTPDRCTITLGCEGRLSPIGLTSSGSSVLSLPPTGASNWYARGSTLSTSKAITEDALYDTSTGSKKQIVIAVSNGLLSFIPDGNAELKLDLNIEQQVAKDYRQYTYRRSAPFTTINGVEDNQSKKVLRYATTDEVSVYLNGVKKEASTDYLLYDGTSTSAAPPNTVLFTSMVTGSNNQIDVVVSQPTAVQTGSMLFARAINDESRVGLGAWEGIDAVKNPVLGTWSLFYCDFSSVTTFPLDIKLRVADLSIRQSSNEPWSSVQGACMLLSRTNVYTELDRQRSVWVPISSLNSDTKYLVVKTVNSSRTMLVTEAAAVDIFPTLDVVRFGAHTLQTTNLTGYTSSAELDNTLITGPDV